MADAVVRAAYAVGVEGGTADTIRSVMVVGCAYCGAVGCSEGRARNALAPIGVVYLTGEAGGRGVWD